MDEAVHGVIDAKLSMVFYGFYAPAHRGRIAVSKIDVRLKLLPATRAIVAGEKILASAYKNVFCGHDL